MNKVYLLLFICVFSKTMLAQNRASVLSLDSAYLYQSKEVVMKEKESNKVIWHSFYKKNFSELLSGNCQFTHTCSHFMKDAVREQGLRGFLIGMNRLIRCGTSDYVYTVFPSFVDKQSFTLIDPVKDYE